MRNNDFAKIRTEAERKTGLRTFAQQNRPLPYKKKQRGKLARISETEKKVSWGPQKSDTDSLRTCHGNFIKIATSPNPCLEKKPSKRQPLSTRRRFSRHQTSPPFLPQPRQLHKKNVIDVLLLIMYLEDLTPYAQ